MLLLKSIHKVNIALRLLISLPARIVMVNNYTRIGLLFILFVALTNKGFAQQDCSVPYIVDLSASPDVSYTEPGAVRSGNCDGGTNCISYKVLINPGTDVLAISSTQFAASDKYYIDGDGPYPVTQTACVSGLSYVIITFCKPGSNKIDITFTTSSGFGVSSDISLRPGCTGTISVTGLIPSTIQWTAISPTDNIPLYNSYLSATSGVSTVTVAPTAAATGGYIDYQVSGIEQSPCNTIHKSSVVRVYTYPALTVSLTSSSSTVCSGNPVTLTATPSGGNPAYTYLWNTGATTSSISVNTPGTYTVSVNDQLSSCGSVTQSINIGATTVMAPTAPAVSICTGNTAMLTATGPGGPYQWYDVNHNPVCNCTSSTITTPVLTSSTTYYVSTTYGGCQSPETAIAVTVLPASPAPTAPPVTVCTGNQATLTATAPGGPYQWYDPSGNPVGNNASYTAPLLPAGTYYYTVTSSSTGCPGQPTTVPVTVVPTPPAPTASSVTICSGNSTTLTATAPGGPYQWYNAAGSLVSTSASYTTPVFTTAGTYNYTVITSFGGCPSPSTQVTVTVLPTPSAPTAPSVTICSGNSTTLTATAPGGPYQWYDAAGSLVSTSASYNTPVFTTAGTYNYTLITSFGGCPSPSTQVTVTVLPTPSAPTASSVTICSNNTATLTATAPGGPYQWYNAAGSLVSTNASYTTPVFTTAGTYNYTLITSFGGCPSPSTQVTVTVLPTPSAPTAPPATICTGTTATLTATAPGGPYQWYDASGSLVCNNCTTYTTPVLTTGASTNTIYNYTVTTMYGGCPSQPTNVPVTVTPLPPTPTVVSQ